MDHNMNGSSSKELLYSEYTGTSVAEHVLETLEKKSIRSLRQKVDKPFEKKGKSETFERVRKLMGLIEKEDASNASTESLNEKSNLSADVKNKEGIQVVMEVDENSPESNINAWFFIDLPKEQESKCSEDEAVKNSVALQSPSISSGTSDDESEQNFPVIANQFVLNETVSSSSSHKKKLKPSKITNNALNFLNNDSSDSSNDELEQNFPVISNGFMLNDSDSSNCSSVESESNLSDSFKMQNSSNFVNDDSSNSSDIKNSLYPSNSKSFVSEENPSCVNNDTLQLSISLKKEKRKFEIVNNRYLNDESVKHYSNFSNPKRLSAQKKTMFIVNDSSDQSLGECGYNESLHNRQKHIFGGNCSDSSSNMGDDLVSGKKRITASLENGSSKFMSNGTDDCVSLADLKKRKICVVEDEISNVCDTENPKKICMLDRKI